MKGITIAPASYKKFTGYGSFAEGMVYQLWKKIWNTHLNRSYIADFELYDERCANPTNAEVDIYIGVK